MEILKSIRKLINLYKKTAAATHKELKVDLIEQAVRIVHRYSPFNRHATYYFTVVSSAFFIGNRLNLHQAHTIKPFVRIIRLAQNLVSLGQKFS